MTKLQSLEVGTFLRHTVVTVYEHINKKRVCVFVGIFKSAELHSPSAASTSCFCFGFTRFTSFYRATQLC